jgi:Tfp pilus assembly protein PilO
MQVPQIPAPPELPTAVFLPPWMTLPPAVVVIISLAFFAACALVLYPLMRAMGRRIEGRSGHDPVLAEEVAQLRARVAEIETMQHRVVELEERVDFAERLLAQRRSGERLPGGQ